MEASQQPAAPPPVGFTITDQVEEPDFTGRDPNATRWTVSFTTDHGVRSTVTVPGADYGAETVSRLIVEKLAKIDAVHQLGNPPPETPA